MKEVIEKLFGFPPAISPEEKHQMDQSGRRLRRLERLVGLRDDPPSNPNEKAKIIKTLTPDPIW